MNCVVCDQAGVAYRLVGEGTLGVCEQCVAEHLATDGDEDGCVYCSRLGTYDLVEDTGAVAGTESPDDYEILLEDIVCSTHVSELQHEEA